MASRFLYLSPMSGQIRDIVTIGVTKPCKAARKTPMLLGMASGSLEGGLGPRWARRSGGGAASSAAVRVSTS